MSSVSKVLKDDGARRDAISLHDRSILVEAGAGSGKTAVMAGRIAAMLAEGVAPRSIAAVTFTELAASELLSRVREFVVDLSDGTIATELRVALPDGLSQAHRDNLAAASAAIDEITCSTIHGFCQRLIKPYPAEADIDPGAGVMDRNQADLTFLEIVDGWLRERLSGGQGGILAEMVLHSPGETVALIHKIAENLRRRRTLSAPPVSPLGGHLTAFRQAAANFAGFMDGAAAADYRARGTLDEWRQEVAALENDHCARRVFEQFCKDKDQALAGAADPDDASVAEQRDRLRFDSQTARVGLSFGPVQRHDVHRAGVAAEMPLLNADAMDSGASTGPQKLAAETAASAACERSTTTSNAVTNPGVTVAVQTVGNALSPTGVTVTRYLPGAKSTPP